MLELRPAALGADDRLHRESGDAPGVGQELGDDLAGVREGLDVASLDGEQRLGIERARGLRRAFGHGLLPDFW